MTFEQLQREVNTWARRNFGTHVEPYHRCLLGAMEELGELAHAHLKAEQSIRGTAKEHEAAGKDAVADTIIYLADYCCARGWDLDAIITETWQTVSRRDWKADPVEGKPNESG
jgi:NTP pyrophosphatase (non-canonical NTP hydrolase)